MHFARHAAGATDRIRGDQAGADSLRGTTTGSLYPALRSATTRLADADYKDNCLRAPVAQKLAKTRAKMHYDDRPVTALYGLEMD
jgi:hypothetical protein